MEKRRPSIITVYIGIVIVVLIIAIILIVSGLKKGKKSDETSKMDRIKSIAGEENIVVDSEGNKLNSSSNMLSSREVDGFVFDNFDISTSSGISTISFEIYNPNEEDMKLGEYELKVLDGAGNTIGRITDNAGTIDGLSRKEVSLNIKGDIANLTDIEIKKIIYENM